MYITLLSSAYMHEWIYVQVKNVNTCTCCRVSSLSTCYNKSTHLDQGKLKCQEWFVCILWNGWYGYQGYEIELMLIWGLIKLDIFSTFNCIIYCKHPLEKYLFPCSKSGNI